MVGIPSLWLPIVLSAVVVFLISAVIHMVLTYHRTDYGKMPGEENVRAAMRKEGVGPGDYMFPHASSPKEMGEPAMAAKYKEGPNGIMTVLPVGPPAMGKNLVQWFIYCLFVSFMTAYVTGRALAPATEYLQVFRIAGTAAFLAYAVGEPVASIWMGRKWSTTLKHTFDGLVYALLTGGMFGWLWPD